MAVPPGLTQTHVGAYVVCKLRVKWEKWTRPTGIVGTMIGRDKGGACLAQWATQTMKSISPYIGEKIAIFVSCGTKEFYMFLDDVKPPRQLD